MYFVFEGFSVNNPMVFDSGEIIHNWDEIPTACNIVKYGAATEHTIGQLNLVTFAARGYTCGYKPPFTSQRKRLTKQIEVFSVTNQVSFAEPGDSGSLVFAVDQNQQRIRALGMLVGGTRYGSVMVTPIWAILGLLHKMKLVKSCSSLLRFPQSYSAASRDPDSAEDSDEGAETSTPERNNALIDELKSEVTAMKAQMNYMEDRIEQIDEKMKEIHESIKSDIARNHGSIKSDLAAIIQQMGSKT